MMQLASNITLLIGLLKGKKPHHIAIRLLTGKKQIYGEAASPEEMCTLKVSGGTLLSQTLSPRHTCIAFPRARKLPRRCLYLGQLLLNHHHVPFSFCITCHKLLFRSRHKATFRTPLLELSLCQTNTTTKGTQSSSES